MPSNITHLDKKNNLYGCETWAMRAELESKMERTEMKMTGWISLKDRQPSTELRDACLAVEATGDVMRRGRP